ncbi:SPX-domain-containing protein [Ophiobolus disseminans]|uniref:SPX-domain-containing protein n=1 Tax=Ophiobolus disseminans TaxID=1469910 RepID=A0A6A7AM10_9PLEO|nr:SPX-domain-containing protein [Ophiobolus disseminans]
MKFGDSLRARSVPEWGHYNIDYDYLKDLIKHQTTPGTNRAVSIPGQGESTERAFRNTFLQVLEAQHDRINLFVRSKSGEIERRLDHISKSLEQLRSKQRADIPGAPLPAKTVERYAKIDADVTRTGEELRSLSRFQVTQRTGFIKILKKYKRWTKDKGLHHAFKEQVTTQPDSLFQLDLGYLLDQYMGVLGALRAVFDNDGERAADCGTANAQSVAARISRTLEEGDELDFDLALTTVPLGSHGNRATYWIHPDHFVEAQVLLLQQMRLYTGGTHTSSDQYLGKEEEVGMLVLDHAEAFAIKQNASTIGSTEATKGNNVFKAAGNVHFVSSGEATVVVCDDTKGPQQSTSNIKSARLRMKALPSVLDTNTQSGQESNGQVRHQNGGDDKDVAAVRQWLADHDEVKPIVGFGSKRTRLVGLHNNPAGGIWATLDKDVYMKASMSKDLGRDQWPTAARSNALDFPHAILEVRREGTQAASLIQSLDRSHLVERVRGFSIEAHAVWACCKPSSMTSPFWIPLLEQDIRKVPEPAKRRSRKAMGSTTGSTSQSSPPMTSTSNTSYDGQLSPLASRNGESSVTSAQEFVDPPPLQAFRKKRRKPYSDYPPPLVSAEQAPEMQRYWNEYDNPEDDDTGGYYIFVEADTSDYPGQKTLQKCKKWARGFLGLKPKGDREDPESAADDESSDDDTLDESPITRGVNYGTLPTLHSRPSQEGYFSSLFRSLQNPHRDAQALQERRTLLGELEIREHKTEMTKLRFYSTCLITAVIIDSILGLMTMTSRKKERGAVDIGVLVGTICTLMLCVVAIISMKTRRERLGWIHQGAVLSIAAGVVALDVLLLSWVAQV